MRTPMARTSDSVRLASSGSLIIIDSVISIHSRCGDTPERVERLANDGREAGVGELARRHVDRHRRGGSGDPFVDPAAQVAQCLGQRPRTDLVDEPGLFGDRDELARRQHDVGRSFPADQRLETAQATGGDVDDRLLVQPHLVAPDRAVERVLHIHAVGDLGLHRVVEQGDPVAAPCLA